MSHPAEGTPEYASWASESKGPTILAVCWTVTTVGLLFAAARLYVRAIIQGKLRIDDYFVIISVATGIISCALTTEAIFHGLGRHFESLTLSEQQQATIWTMAAFCPGVMSFGFPKLAVVALLTRLLLPGKQHFYFLWALVIMSLLTLFATVGLLIGRCYPVSYLWDKSIDGHCFSPNVQIYYSYFSGAYSAFVDLYLAAYPSVVLFRLRMPTKQKYALSAALGVGLISVIVAIYKVTRLPSLGDPDFTYATSDLQMWTVIEGSSMVIASSVPILQPLMEMIFGRNILRSSSNRNVGLAGDFRSQGKLASSVERRIRAKKQIMADDLEMTALDRVGSQENILPAAVDDRPRRMDSRRSVGFNMGDGTRGIMRTQEVEVRHETAYMKKDIGIRAWDSSG
ncbi:integral membrane protein [Xylariaceae sp. FL0016]|nr:integral membrane protein [Xylariaceae sp. FL0016]